MIRKEIKSPAFQTAELQSERLRIFSLFGFIGIFVAVTLVRVFLTRTASLTTPWAWNLALASAVIAYEGWMLRTVESGPLRGTRPSRVGLGTKHRTRHQSLHSRSPLTARRWRSRLARSQSGHSRLFYPCHYLHAAIEFHALFSGGRGGGGHLYPCGVVSGLAASYARCARSGYANQREPVCGHPSGGRASRRRGGAANPQACGGSASRGRLHAKTGGDPTRPAGRALHPAVAPATRTAQNCRVRDCRLESTG